MFECQYVLDAIRLINRPVWVCVQRQKYWAHKRLTTDVSVEYLQHYKNSCSVLTSRKQEFVACKFAKNGVTGYTYHS